MFKYQLNSTTYQERLRDWPDDIQQPACRRGAKSSGVNRKMSKF